MSDNLNKEMKMTNLRVIDFQEVTKDIVLASLVTASNGEVKKLTFTFDNLLHEVIYKVYSKGQVVLTTSMAYNAVDKYNKL